MLLESLCRMNCMNLIITEKESDLVKFWRVSYLGCGILGREINISVSRKNIKNDILSVLYVFLTILLITYSTDLDTCNVIVWPLLFALSISITEHRVVMTEIISFTS